MTKAIVFGGAYDLGGSTGESFLQWTTTDHINWSSSDTSSLGITTSNMLGNATVFFNGQFYMMTTTHNVYTSNGNGSWTKIGTANLPTTSSSNFRLFVFQENLYKIGGSSGTGFNPNSLYKSADGLNWTKVSDVVTGAYFSSGQVIVANNKIYLLGFVANTSTGYNNTVYESSDGITWTTRTAQYSARYNVVANYINGKFVIIGGNNSSGGQINDLWTSTDAITWTQGTYPSAFPSGGVARALSYVADGKMYVFGSTTFTNIMSSTDGTNWSVANASPPSQIMYKRQTQVAVEGAVTPKIQASASSTSSVSMTLNLGALLTIQGNLNSVSSGNAVFQLGSVLQLNNIKGQSLSAWSTMNLFIGTNDLTTYLVKGSVMIDGSPAANIAVKAINKNDNRYIFTAMTDSNGQYVLSCDMPGEYLVVCYGELTGRKLTSKARSFITIGGGA